MESRGRSQPKIGLSCACAISPKPSRIGTSSMRPAILVATALVSLAAASCTQLPLSGPDDRTIIQAASTVAVRDPQSVAYQYALVDLDACVVAHVYDIDGGSFFKSFGTGRGLAPIV